MQSAVTAIYYVNSVISWSHIAIFPHSMLKGHIRPTVKNSFGNKTDLKDYRPVKNSSKFLKVLE